MTMTLITWLREEKIATVKTSICQTVQNQECPFHPWYQEHMEADGAGQGWELSSKVMIPSSGSQKWKIMY